MLPEFYIAAILAGILLLYLLFSLLNKSRKHTTRKQQIVTELQSARTKSLKLQERLSNYILSNSVATDVFTEGLTYKEYLKTLQKNHIQNLSDKNMARIKNTNNRIILMQAKDMISGQQALLAEAEEKINTVLKD